MNTKLEKKLDQFVCLLSLIVKFINYETEGY